jgi:hypothetical protein
MLDQSELFAIERTGNAVTAGMLIRHRREVRKDKTRSQEDNLGNEKKPSALNVGASAHTWINTSARPR